MADITLGGHTYILEAIEDAEAPSHDYDATLDVSAESSVEELDQWFEKVEAEWESLPKEIQTKVTDKLLELTEKLAEKSEPTTEEPSEN